ncbi:hypothetical protein PRO82_000151 [Candidatus Protochlamydia amoebophila]|nr:hypothetical protein [Candidatus Protochlamydia amoebophila]
MHKKSRQVLARQVGPRDKKLLSFFLQNYPNHLKKSPLFH